jgi:3-oxoacyl-[acyl-carrier protein] reductase
MSVCPTKKKTFLITGGSGGIGSLLAKYLYDSGYIPLVCYSQNKAKAKQIAQKYNGEAIQLDLTSQKDINETIDYLSSSEDTLSGVVLNASPPLNIISFGQTSLNDMTLQWQVNVLGHFLLLAGLVRKVFRKSNSGVVVGILSEAMGKEEEAGMSSAASYIIAKYGLKGLLSVLKKEYSWLDIISMSPGFVDTKMLYDSFDERFIDSLKKAREVKPADEIARAIVKKITTTIQEKHE